MTQLSEANVAISKEVNNSRGSDCLGWECLG